MENSAKAFFEHLNKKNLSEKSFEEVVAKWTPTQIIDFIIESKALLPTDKAASDSIFDFIANSSLSGGRHPCVAKSCRLSRVDSLARFASLYSDSVLIQDPFPSVKSDSQYTSVKESFLKYDLITTIGILYKLRPLIEKGIIGFAASEFHFCRDCYERYIRDIGFDNTKSKIYKILEHKFLYEVNYKVVVRDNFPVIEATGPEELVEHGQAYRIPVGEKLLQAVSKHEKTGKNLLFSKRKVKESGLLDSDINPIISDIVLQNFYSELYHTQYITDHELDLELIGAANATDVNILSNSLIKGFAHSIPYLSDIEVSQLLKLRDVEGEAFNVYRDSFTQAIKSVSGPNAQKVKQAFDDIVRPELNNIELAIKNSRKLLWGSLTQDIIFGTGFITVGLFSGLLPPNIGEIVAALGGFNFVAGSLDKINKLTQEPSEIRNNKYYFLWKANRENRN